MGAGPGDPDLITVKGLKRLTEADFVAYDSLVSELLLEKCCDDAELIFVGKHSDKALSWQQEDINKLLVDKAKQGLKIVRLKGGDPLVFGRGGEEALALRAANIPFEIVPGISACIAAPAYAGIPVTHRHVSTSFTVVTGHEDPLKPHTTVDWEVLAKVETLVVLMVVGRLKQITKQLIKYRQPETPAALVYWGTTAKQKVIIDTLVNIASAAKKQNITPPATLIVGKVVALGKELEWFSFDEPLL